MLRKKFKQFLAESSTLLAYLLEYARRYMQLAWLRMDGLLGGKVRAALAAARKGFAALGSAYERFLPAALRNTLRRYGNFIALGWHRFWTAAAPHLATWKNFLAQALRQRWRQLLIGGFATVFSICALIVLIATISYLSDRKMIESSLNDYKRYLQGYGTRLMKPPVRILGEDGQLIGEFLPERDSRITMDTYRQMYWLRRAAVSSEDRYFFEHHGVSPRGILRALINNILSFSVREGGGSITQQVARNVYADRGTLPLIRKVYETIAAFHIEARLNKDEILCLYLNKIYMGEGRIGAEEASWFYFRKPPEQLDAAEAAMIVGLFPSPVRYSPLNNIRFSLRKQEMVMDTMVRDGHLTQPQKDQALKMFKYRYAVNDKDPGLVGAFGASRDFRTNLAPSANEYVKQFLYENIPEEKIRSGGLTVYTTIDPVRQAAALSAVRDQVSLVRQTLQSAQGNPATLNQISSRVNGVLVSMEAKTGAVRAIVGGYEVSEGNMMHRVYRMQRQPGSVLKGFLYAVALDEGVLELSSEVIDEPVSIHGYKPRNWYGDYKGTMSLSQAVAMSVNTVAVKTLADIGVSRFRDRLIAGLDLGYGESRNRFPGNLSLALGSGELTPMELTQLYALVLNGGAVVKPKLILKVTDSDNEVVWEDYNVGKDGDVVLSEEACDGAVALMRTVFDEDGTASWIGKRRKSDPGYLAFPVAGKSGTVQLDPAVQKKFPGVLGVHDAWFVGLVPGEVTAVWIGNDEGAPIPGSGAGTAGAVWAEYAQKALPGRVSGNFREPGKGYTIKSNAHPIVPPKDIVPEGESEAESSRSEAEPARQDDPKPWNPQPKENNQAADPVLVPKPSGSGSTENPQG